MDTMNNPYDEPADVVLEGAIGWYYETTGDPADAGRWIPTAWVVVYPDHVLTIDYNTQLGVRDVYLRPVDKLKRC